jgi:hypothetical protein
MLVGLSVILAVITVPFLAVALIRTLRISQTAADDAHAKTIRCGLIATFCRSLLLIVTLLAVALATAAFASLAAALMVLNMMTRMCKPIVRMLQPLLTRAWTILIAAAQHVISIASYSNLDRLLNWTSAHALLGTRYLIAATSILHHRYWHFGATSRRLTTND